jgi:hypothetical protein
MSVDLAFKFASCPIIIRSLKFVVLAFVLVRNLNQRAILSPIELRTRCVRNWIFIIELSCLFQLSDSEPAVVLRD